MGSARPHSSGLGPLSQPGVTARAAPERGGNPLIDGTVDSGARKPREAYDRDLSVIEIGVAAGDGFADRNRVGKKFVDDAWLDRR